MGKIDVVIVGSGPNGLAAGILLQQHGLSVIILEGKKTIGGGLRTQELTLPGFLHDVCAAVHPMAAASPFFQSLPLKEHGLEYIIPEIAAAHPFDNGKAAILQRSLAKTALALGPDEQSYLSLIKSLTSDYPLIATELLSPFHFPKHPVAMAKFGFHALQPATLLSKSFRTEEARGLFAGMAAHSIQPLSNWATSAIALVLMINGHIGGWPVPKGGSGNVAHALASYFLSLGGKIETDQYIKSLHELPSASAVLFDITPRQLLKIAGHKFSNIYKWQLERYRYGMGVFKVDWALAEVIPFQAHQAKLASTVHIGGTLAEIASSEEMTSKGYHSDVPFVKLTQSSVFDATRAPKDKHTAWAYCHVPNGSTKDMTEEIERQVERFAPGFRERILARHTLNTEQLENYNPNYIGGDINGGIIDLAQLFTRPALRSSPYRTSAKGLYLCSSSTPPGSGIHGMCGYHAAKRVLRDIFNITGLNAG